MQNKGYVGQCLTHISQVDLLLSLEFGATVGLLITPSAILLFRLAFELVFFSRGKGENHRMSYGKSRNYVYKPYQILILAGNFNVAN